MKKIVIENNIKKCSKCKRLLSLNFFHTRKDNASGYRSSCKECSSAQSKEYRISNNISSRNNALKLKYDLSEEDYNKILKSQNDVCKICKNSESQIHHSTGVIQNLSVDHCHETGKVRGLLCHKCNTGLGAIQDDVEILQSMIEYLTTEQITTVLADALGTGRNGSGARRY